MRVRVDPRSRARPKSRDRVAKFAGQAFQPPVELIGEELRETRSGAGQPLDHSVRVPDLGLPARQGCRVVGGPCSPGRSVDARDHLDRRICDLVARVDEDVTLDGRGDVLEKQDTQPRPGIEKSAVAVGDGSAQRVAHRTMEQQGALSPGDAVVLDDERDAATVRRARDEAMDLPAEAVLGAVRATRRTGPNGQRGKP